MAQRDTVNDLFTDITKTLDDLEQRLAFITDRAELGDAMCTAVELGHQVDALQARIGLLATNNNVAAAAGQRTIGQFVAARTNSRALDIDRKVKRAKWLRDFPIFEAAHGQGLTDLHVDYLRKHLDRTYDSHVVLVDDQQFFVDFAALCSFAGFMQVCEYWLVFIDPDGKEPTDQIDKAFLSISKGRGAEVNSKASATLSPARSSTPR